VTDKKKLPDDFDWKAFTPDDSPRTPVDLFSDPKHMDLATAKLNEGDPCYNFKSHVYDYSEGSEKDTGRTFHLVEASKEKPVALIFGSYT